MATIAMLIGGAIINAVAFGVVGFATYEITKD